MGSLNISVARLVFNFLDAKFRDTGVPLMDNPNNDHYPERQDHVDICTQIHQTSEGMIEALTVSVHFKKQGSVQSFTLDGFPRDTKEWHAFIYPGSKTKQSITRSIDELMQWKNRIMQHQSSKRRRIKVEL